MFVMSDASLVLPHPNSATYLELSRPGNIQTCASMLDCKTAFPPVALGGDGIPFPNRAEGLVVLHGNRQ
eukprot:6209757-Pleurochrysis_carterae.AAC.4